MRHILGLGASLAAFWMLLSGSISLDHKLVLGFGVASVIVTMFLAIRMDRLDGFAVSIRLSPKLVTYWIWPASEIGMAKPKVDQL